MIHSYDFHRFFSARGRMRTGKQEMDLLVLVNTVEAMLFEKYPVNKVKRKQRLPCLESVIYFSRLIYREFNEINACLSGNVVPSV